MAANTVQAASWYSHIPTVTQTIFWIVIAAVTVATFMQARRTFFQPLRTEVFKRQLDLMTGLLTILVGKSEHELRAYFRIDDALAANTQMMYDAYLERSDFGVRIKDPDGRLYSPDRCPVWRVHVDALVSADDYVKPPDDEPTVAGPTTPEPWSDYRHLSLAIPRELQAAKDELTSFVHNPLLPTECAELVLALLQRVDDNIDLIGDVLTEKAADMPANYPDLDSMQRMSTNWILNAWNARAHHLEPAATAIVAYAREYFGADSLFDRRRRESAGRRGGGATVGPT